MDLCEVIEQIREDRMALVQHTIQYKFAYQACVHYVSKLVSRSNDPSWAASVSAKFLSEHFCRCVLNLGSELKRRCAIAAMPGI